MSVEGQINRGKKWYSLKAVASFNKDAKALKWLEQPQITKDIEAYLATLPKAKKGSK